MLVRFPECRIFRTDRQALAGSERLVSDESCSEKPLDVVMPSLPRTFYSVRV